MNADITKQMEMVLYRTEDDNVTVSALIKDETIWLTQKAMAELFGIDKSGISRHLSKIFETGELDESLVVAKIATPNPHGKTLPMVVFSSLIPQLQKTTWTKSKSGNWNVQSPVTLTI